MPPTTDGDIHAQLTREDVAQLAQLARLQLTDEELDLYAGQLSVILDSVATVSRGRDRRTSSRPRHAVPLTNVSATTSSARA